MSVGKELHVVLLAGGVGTRLWPISRRSRPKQFQALFSERSLLQQTYDRVRPLTSPENIWVVTGIEFTDLVREQLPEVSADQILGEPEGKNTAPAAALAVARIARARPGAIVLVTPSDSFIRDDSAYQEYVSLAVEVAAAGHIVTMGIVPSRPDTGLGYIQRGERLERPTTWAYRVARFTEKPDAETAARYVADGGYYWNMGHFIFSAKKFMESCDKYLSEVATGVRKLASVPASNRELMAEVYRTFPNISLDYGIAEKETDMVVIPTALEWSDLGSWSAVKETYARHGGADADAEDHLEVNCSDCLVLPRSGRLVVTVGMEGCVVVDTPDAVLVIRDEASQEMRDALAQLEKKNKTEYL